jgi:hypothetical protein
MPTPARKRHSVRVIVRAIDRHASGLLAGLSLLHRRGEISLTQQVLPPPPPLTSGPWHLRDKDDSNLEIFVDERASGFVDFHDSWEINESGHDSHDVYFKRSLDSSRLPPERRGKLEPLGLVYEVWRDGFDSWELRRLAQQAAPLGRRVADLTRLGAQVGAGWLGLGSRPTISTTSGPPEPDLPVRVLFMVGLWDPTVVARNDPSRVPEFEAINAMRRDCVLQLRQAFRASFTGGTQHSPFATRFAPQALMPDPDAASKSSYLELVRKHPICVATMGLHGSNGGKLAEYVALSRAVVSEPLRYSVPGHFEPERNFLAFTTPDECVKQASRLASDHALRERVMSENRAYYATWMRPDALATRVIDTIVQRRR